jgi:hypothetical protein
MKKSLYDFANNRKTYLQNTGFDYEGKIFNRTLSPYIMEDEKRADILHKYEEMIYFLIEKVKLIKTFYNYTVPKDYKYLN